MQVNLISPRMKNPLIYLSEVDNVYYNKTTLLRMIPNNKPEYYECDFDRVVHDEALAQCIKIMNEGRHCIFENMQLSWFMYEIPKKLIPKLRKSRNAFFMTVGECYLPMCFDIAERFIMPRFDNLSEDKRYRAEAAIKKHLQSVQNTYDELLQLGAEREDASSIFPEHISSSLRMGMSLREFLFNFLPYRGKSKNKDLMELSKEMFKAVQRKYVEDTHFTEFLNYYR